MRLHRFNDEGVSRFADFLQALGGDPALTVPSDLLTDPACAVEVPPGPEIEGRTFGSRMEAAR